MPKQTISAKDKISAVMLYFEGNISQHQLNLGVLTPMEKREIYLQAA